jgi:hypothetical protein
MADCGDKEYGAFYPEGDMRELITAMERFIG